MEEYVGLVVLEHLGNELDVHVLDVDFLKENLAARRQPLGYIAYLEALIEKHDSFIELLL